MPWRGWWPPLVLLSISTGVAGGQDRYPLATGTQGTHFIEAIGTTVFSQTAGGEVHRDLVRRGVYGLQSHGDTLVVSADSLDLRETSDRTGRVLNTDGFVGGRFRLLFLPGGDFRVLVRPFVPPDLAEVTDLERAMDDFLPPRPPALLVGGKASAGAALQWDRLSDSAGLERYRWRRTVTTDSTRLVADTVPLALKESFRDDGAMAWDPRRGPVQWHREVVSTSTAQIRGQQVRTRVTQQIDVRRAPASLR